MNWRMDQLAGDTGISAVEEKIAQYKGGQTTKKYLAKGTKLTVNGR